MAAWGRSKYGAEAVVEDGWRFDSKAEAIRYRELLLRGRAGEIADLELQPVFLIVVNGIRIATYRADFAYRDLQAGGAFVVEDVKGVRTPVYRLKKRLVEALHGIVIREITYG